MSFFKDSSYNEPEIEVNAEKGPKKGQGKKSTPSKKKIGTLSKKTIETSSSKKKSSVKSIPRKKEEGVKKQKKKELKKIPHFLLGKLSNPIDHSSPPTTSTGRIHSGD